MFPMSAVVGRGMVPRSFSDNFDRPDGLLLPSPDWIQAGIGDGGVKIVSNSLLSEFGGGTGNRSAVATALPRNSSRAFVQARIIVPNSGFSLAVAYIVDANNMIGLQTIGAAAAPYLSIMQGGELGGGTIVGSNGASGDVHRLEVDPPAALIRVLRNGAVIHTRALPSGFPAGIRTGLWVLSTVTNPLDDFSTGDL